MAVHIDAERLGEPTKARHLRQRFLILVLSLPIHLYRLVISPMLGPRCRYLPTCSDYALEALSRHGAVKGTWLATKRLVRCHPWGGSGHDPVPPA